MSANENFAASMKQAREIAGISQGALSRKLVAAGFRVFHQTTIARIEAGDRPVKLDEAVVISEHLGVPLQDMINHGAADTGLSARLAELESLQAVIVDRITTLRPQGAHHE